MMSQALKAITKISLLLISSFLVSCAYFDFSDGTVAHDEVRILSDREKLLQQAERYFEKKDYESSEPIYVRLSRFNEGSYDPVYDQALWRLAKIYEKNNESEKAILSLDELSARHSSSVPKNKVRLALMKNHYRLSNFLVAERMDKLIYQDYKNKNIELSDLYQYLIEMTDLGYDSHLPEELLFLGEVQKYFIFIMEKNLQPESEKITDHLINNYEHYFSVLQQSVLSQELKKRLAISLYNQLNKFDKYSLVYPDSSPKEILRFSEYCENKKKILIERFYQ